MKHGRRHRLARRAAAAVLAACVLAGCSNSQPPPAEYQLPDIVQFSYRWAGAPGLDLTSDAAIVTRAFLESAFIASVSQTTAKSDIGKYTYPGYTRAVDTAIGEQDKSFYHSWDPGLLDALVPVHGTAYAYLASLTTPPGDTSGRTVDVSTCLWFNGLSVSFTPDKYRSLIDYALVPQAVKITLRAPQDNTSKLTAFGQGTARYPTSDVFGEWTVSSVEVNSSWHRMRSGYQDPCAALPNNPVPPELLNTTRLTFYPNHLPSLAPYPGWPTDNSDPARP